MSIDIITGQPRNGKSQVAVGKIIIERLIKENDKREKQGKPRLPIFTDIDGINAPETKIKLKDCVTVFEREKIWFGEHDDPDCPPDFWKPPYGSSFLFDECHKRKWVEETTGTISKNPTTKSLNEHGHAGHQIWLITQFPQYIHTHIRGLVQEHWHVKRIIGLRRAYIYKWDEFIANPRADTNLKNVYEKETFKFKKKYELAYKSASSHAKIAVKIPPIAYVFIAAVVLIFGFVAYKLPSTMFGKHLGMQDEKIQQTENKLDEQQNQLDSVKTQNRQQLEEINKLRFELEELKAKYLPRHIYQLAEHEDLRPAMVIATDNGGCTSFNRYGEPLILPTELCLQMDKYPSMIPRSRVAVQNLSDTQLQPQQISTNQQQDNANTTNIQKFDTKRELTNNS